MTKRERRGNAGRKQSAAELPVGLSRRALTRPWLLGGTATAAGMLAIGLASPAMAAACLDNTGGSTEIMICAGPDSAAEPFTATKDFDASFGTLVPDHPYLWTGIQSTTTTTGAVTLDAHGHQGTVTLQPGSSIVNQTGNGLVVRSPVESTININDLIEGGAGASYNEEGAVSPHNADGLRVLGPAGNLSINVYQTQDTVGQVVGSDDGVVILGSLGSTSDEPSSDDSISLHNAGNIVGRGLSGQSSNDSEGIHVYQNGTFGTNILGSADIENQGFVFGSPTATGDANNGGGQGISVSAGGYITIVNNTYAADDLTPDLSSGVAVILGRDGIKAQGGSGVTVDNSARGNYGGVESGGLISGYAGDGVNVESASGDVKIDNGGTWGDASGLSALPDILASSTLGLPTQFSEDPALPPSRGIWGTTDGIYVGATEDGDVTINNSFLTGSDQNVGNGGVIAGESNAAVEMNLGTFSSHLASIDNRGGRMMGGEDGASIQQDGGGTLINNANGIIQGIFDKGVAIGNSGTMPDRVVIANGNFGKAAEDDLGDGSQGGIITGATMGVDVYAQEALVYSGVNGVILGEGSYDNPVIQLHTGSEDTPDGFGGMVWNKGLIASADIPYYSDELGGLDVVRGQDEGLTFIPGLFDDNQGLVGAVSSDVSSISNSVWNGGQGGVPSSTLGLYALAASDVMLKARNGSTDLINDAGGIMIGRVNLRGSTYSEESDSTAGNLIVNLGTWLTTDAVVTEDGITYYGNEIHGSNLDEVDNAGLIQGAFIADGPERLDFNGVNDFYNGSYSLPSQPDPVQDGLISLIDGGTGDALYISHNFHGNDGTSLVGLDVNFAPATAEDPTAVALDGDPSAWRSDRFQFGSSEDGGVTDGSTGLIIHKAGTGTDTIGDTILVGNVGSVSQDCVNTDACKDGDPFYIASRSQGYLDVGGTGAIQDGMYAWYLTQQNNTEDGGPNFVLESDWSPQAQDLGALVTGGQNIWYDTSSDVQDHINNVVGGGGGDLAVGQKPTSGNGVTAWAKASGSLFRRNSSVTATVPPAGPVTINTSLVQDTFGLLAGADFDPGDTSGIRAGAFGGFVGSGLTFSSFGASASYLGGSGGVYVSYVPDATSGIFVDGEAKADLLGVSYKAPGAFSATGTMTSIGFTGNAGYKIDAGNNMQVAPVASLSVVDTMLSGFSAGGGTASFSNGLSIRPGIGVELGTTVPMADGMSADLSVSAKLWDELGAPNKVTLSDGTNSFVFGDGISGPFGELRASGTLYTSDPTLQVFGSSGVKSNGSFVAVDAKVGAKKSF